MQVQLLLMNLCHHRNVFRVHFSYVNTFHIKLDPIMLGLLGAANHIHNHVFIKKNILYKDFIKMLIATGIICT